MTGPSPLEVLLARKLGDEYYRYALGENRTAVLLPKLKEVLRSEVAILLRTFGMSTPPFDPTTIQKIGKANVTLRYSPRAVVGADGSVQVSSDGFVINIDQNLKHATNRLRSTIAHELMHTFFYDIETLPPEKLGQDPNARWHLLIEEEICAHLAREFLVPAFSVTDGLEQDSSLKMPSVSALEQLRSVYKVSSDILAYRMILDLSVWDAVFVKFLRGSNSYVAKTKMKSKLSRRFQPFKIPARVVVGDHHTTYLRHIENSLVFAESNGTHTEHCEIGPHSYQIESKRDSTNPTTVYALVTSA